ncbi:MULTISPECIES: hypothetical protein [Mycobacterium]|uniref:hypothetical protein n=1 Tax=Mycobacterium TaxID=1763 RepID=UPI001EE1AB15|nr:MULTISPECIES: hypothetical protein [Mycobacterium]
MVSHDCHPLGGETCSSTPIRSLTGCHAADELPLGTGATASLIANHHTICQTANSDEEKR